MVYNYISGIVKILESPVQTVFDNDIPITKFRVQFHKLERISLSI
jgi:hypothetical protein